MPSARSRFTLALLLLGACPQSDAGTAATVGVTPSNLASDEEVRFIPTFATKTDKGWEAPIEAWVFEPEEDGPVRAATVELVEEAMEAKVDEETSERIAENLRPFMVDNERGKRVVVRGGDRATRVCTSGPDGRCSGALVVPSEAAGTLDVELVLPASDGRRFAGRVHLLEDAGVSVLSDIDDTIKITEVHDKKKLLDNTFARPFRPCPGMVGLYQRWEGQGAAFHYVSNSPLPLLDAIDGFLAAEGYPKGSIKLKPFRWRDGTFVELLAAPEDHKEGVIAQHIERFEHRRFVLVGDTGERDPEIYAAVARKYGERVAKIYLRDTGSMPKSELQKRLTTAFDGLPRELWVAFEDGAAVRDDLPGG